jgi:hypothetical protein
MTLLAVVVMLLLGISVIALAIGSAEPPHDIQTFGHSSPEEQAFERRAMRLQVIGFASIALAVLVGLIGALELIV